MCLTIWIACVGVFLESTRVRGLASRLDRTAASALESVMADYNKTVMEQYNLFVLDYGEELNNKKEVLARWKTYFKKESDETMGNILYKLLFDAEWFSLTGINYNIETTWTLINQDGELFANQVAQYMKYKEIGNIVSTLLEQVNVIQKGVEGQETLNSLWKTNNTENGIENANTLVSYEEENRYIVLSTKIDASSEKISAVGLPSQLQGITIGEPSSSPVWNDISKEVLMGEYILEYFTSYGDNENSQDKMVCQQEYILFGKLSDKENMKCISNLLLSVRCGLNLISLLSSESMQAVVETTAVTISSALMNPELAPLFQMILNCVWVYKESEQDVEALLNGEKVPFLKEESQWIETVLKWGETEETKEQLKSTNNASPSTNTANTIMEELKKIGSTEKKFYSLDMSYEDYIRIFFLFLTPKTKYYRAMDMIQIKMQKTYPNFSIANCICGIEATVIAKGKSKFLMFIPWNMKKQYKITRTVSFLY